MCALQAAGIGSRKEAQFSVLLLLNTDELRNEISALIYSALRTERLPLPLLSRTKDQWIAERSAHREAAKGEQAGLLG